MGVEVGKNGEDIVQRMERVLEEQGAAYEVDGGASTEFLAAVPHSVRLAGA
jgi:hypothetical protein